MALDEAFSCWTVFLTTLDSERVVYKTVIFCKSSAVFRKYFISFNSFHPRLVISSIFTSFKFCKNETSCDSLRPTDLIFYSTNKYISRLIKKMVRMKTNIVFEETDNAIRIPFQIPWDFFYIFLRKVHATSVFLSKRMLQLALGHCWHVQ